MHVTILGKRWKLRFVPNLGGDDKEIKCGDCDHPNAKNKEIRIRLGLDEELELDSLIHEAMHAAQPIATEEFVDELATDISRVLFRLGWRKLK